MSCARRFFFFFFNFLKKNNIKKFFKWGIGYPDHSKLEHKTAPKPTLKQIKGQGVAGTTLTEAQVVSKTTRSQAHFKKCSAVLLRLQKFWIVSIESNVSMALWQRFGQHLMAPSYKNTGGFQERGSRHLSPPWQTRGRRSPRERLKRSKVLDTNRTQLLTSTSNVLAQADLR